jgi:hypothetical protein
MKNIETFIFIHDEDIVLDFIEKNRFSSFEGFKYVFLGNKPYEKIKHLNNLIVARELPDNIEHIPKLTSFTGWYALYKNGYLNTEFVNLFEYDINYVPEFPAINNEMTKKEFDFVGYFPMSISDIVYLKMSQYSSELVQSIKNKMGYNVVEVINELQKKNPNMMWSSSSNSTWRTEQLTKFIDWFSNFIDDIKNSDYCGHMHERSLSFYYFKENLKVFLVSNLMTHVQLNSHGTSPLPPERAEYLYKTLI